MSILLTVYVTLSYVAGIKLFHPYRCGKRLSGIAGRIAIYRIAIYLLSPISVPIMLLLLLAAS